MGLPLDWRSDPIVQIENVMLPVLVGTCAVVLDGGPGSPTRVDWQRDMEKLLNLLRSGADDWLAPTGFAIGDAERALCTAAADQLALLTSRMSGELSTLDRSETVTFFLSECQPTLLRALDGIRSVFIGGVLARQAQHASNTERALHELGTISKTILFISINASIEASRAGEAGRSFSVIADDIRSLAQNAQQTIASIKAG